MWGQVEMSHPRALSQAAQAASPFTHHQTTRPHLFPFQSSGLGSRGVTGPWPPPEAKEGQQAEEEVGVGMDTAICSG